MRSTDQGLLHRTLTLTAVMATVVALSTNAAWAITTIVQDPNDKWLAFEAEDYHELIDLDNDGVTWQTVDDVDASGGKVIIADTGVNFDTNEAEAVYNVKFTRPDHYHVYARYKNLGVTGNNDTFWSSGDPDSIFPNSLRTWFSDSPAEIVRSLGSDDAENSVAGVPEFFYAFVGAASISFDVNDAAQIGDQLEFRIGIREQGSVLDRIVFVDSSTPGPSDQTTPGRYSPLFQLDALTNSPLEVDALAGDFNGDGALDAADYTVWRDNLGAADESSINNNGDGLNGVDAADYPLWSGGFGSSTSTAVPEPTTGILLLVGGLMVSVRQRR